MSNSHIQNLPKLSNKLQKNKKLENICDDFFQNYHITPSIGVEIEFYLSDDIDIVEFETRLSIPIKAERGKNQYEINLLPSVSLPDYITKIYNTMDDIKRTASELGCVADFNSKPFIDDYGSSMQFNISFLHNDIYVDDMSFLEHAAKSLCHFMLNSLLIFLPMEEDYRRLNKDFMAPTHISFGNNNRSVAVRIPQIGHKRLEYRIASNAVDLYLAITAILMQVYIGMRSPNMITQLDKTYGNAFDPIYNLQALPKTLSEAAAMFDPSFFEL